uniref:RNase H n=1 Tax=Digenea simplex TaxID=945030 RepID=A0A4D6I9R1_DIGSM|nr:RNase H [Digenea simplex]
MHTSLILAKRVVRYLSGTASKSIIFASGSINSQPLTAYADADWAGCHETRRSTTGIVIKVNIAPIYWTSKRQSIITLSSAEAEYIALSTCAKQITWMRRLFYELANHTPCKTDSFLPPTILNTDSTSAISLATNTQVSERNNHIEIKAHHIKQLINRGIIEQKYVNKLDQIADILTKSVFGI